MTGGRGVFRTGTGSNSTQPSSSRSRSRLSNISTRYRPQDVCGSGLHAARKYLSLSGYGMEEFRPGGIDQLVDHFRLDRSSRARDSLHGSFRLVPALGHVEQHQFPSPGRAVMAGDDPHELRRAVGDGPGVENAVGPEAAAGIVGPLPRPVGIHRHQPAGEGVRDVRVLPPRVQDAAVGHQRGIEVVVLVEAQTAHRRAVGVGDAEVRHLVAPPLARDRLETGRRGEQDRDRRPGSRSRSCPHPVPHRVSPGAVPGHSTPISKICQRP